MIKRKICLLRAVSLIGVTVAAVWLLPGCAVFFAILEKLFPKEKIPPRFILPAGKRVLVFPDDLHYPLSYPPIKRTLTEKANKLLVEHKVAAETINYDKLVDLRNAEPKFNLMHIPTIGRRLGADLVIYVSITEFTLRDNPADTLWHGRLTGRIRVVDVLKGRIWPDESAGFEIEIVEPATVNPSEAYGEELSRTLAERMAEKVCGLFYEHYVDRARPREKETGSMSGQ